MSAHLKIDQATLPAGVAGKSRTDGAAGGQLVTLTDTSPSATTRFRLLWKTLGDTTAESSLACPDPVGAPKVWTFSPTASRYGTFRIELIKDEGLPSESREIRTLSIRTPTLGLVIPALNERASSAASLQNAGAAQIELAENNADDFTSQVALNSLRYAAWWRVWHELTMAVDSLAAGGGAVSSVFGRTGAVVAVAGDYDSSEVTDSSTVGGPNVDDSLSTLNADLTALAAVAVTVESGGGPGLLSRHVYANVGSTKIGATVAGVTVAVAPTWNVAADIPPGNLFRVVLYGPAAGGNGGDGTASFSNSATGGGATGGGARRERWYSRKELIDALPIAWGLPLGGAGGAGATGVGNQVGTRGAAPSGPATFGSLLIAFQGGRAAATALGTAEGGGGGGGEESAGLDGSGSNAGAGGGPFGGAGSASGNNPSLFGGGSGGGSAKGGDSRTGGGGGSGALTAGNAPLAGGGSQEGGTGGGGGGGQSAGGVAANGGAGGDRLAPTVAGSAGGVAGGAIDGTDGADCDVHHGGMGGGGGANASGVSPQTGGQGGNGGFGGGGAGGGGGAAGTGGAVNTAGNGGNGGDAAGILECYA